MDKATLIITSLVTAIFGFYIGQQFQKNSAPQAPIQQESCDFNIHARITPVTDKKGFLIYETKKRLQIDFNGVEVMTGYLDDSNNAELFGAYKGLDATAKCSGAEIIVCKINYKGNSTNITLKGE